jgi:hypothetical protein
MCMNSNICTVVHACLEIKCMNHIVYENYLTDFLRVCSMMFYTVNARFFSRSIMFHNFEQCLMQYCCDYRGVSSNLCIRF